MRLKGIARYSPQAQSAKVSRDIISLHFSWTLRAIHTSVLKRQIVVDIIVGHLCLSKQDNLIPSISMVNLKTIIAD